MKFVQLLSSQSLVESSADFGAVQPKFDVIHPIDHGVLGAFQFAIDNQSIKNGNLTLMVVRIIPTISNTAWAGVILENPFARLTATMAPSNASRVLSRPLGRCDLASMVETRSSGERIVRCEGCEEGSES